MWQYVKSWSETLISLLENSDEERENLSSALALKVEAHMQLQQLAEAVDTAQRLASREASVRSLVTLFKALLRSEEFSVEMLLGRMLPCFQHAQQITVEEKLQLLLMCAHITQSSTSMFLTSEKRHALIGRLLWEWLQFFSQENFWRHCDVVVIEDEEGRRHCAVDGDVMDVSRQSSVHNTGSTTVLATDWEVASEFAHREIMFLLNELRMRYSAIGLLVDASLDRDIQDLLNIFEGVVDINEQNSVHKLTTVDDNATTNINQSVVHRQVDMLSLLSKLAHMQPDIASALLFPCVCERLIPLLDLLVNNLLQTKDNPVWRTALGATSHLIFVADLCYQLAQLMLDMRTNQNFNHNATVVNDHANSQSKKRGSIHELMFWSRLIDNVENLYSLADSQIKKPRVLCLVLNAVYLLEAFDLQSAEEVSDNISADAERTMSTAQTLVDEATQRLVRAASLQRDYMDFADAEDEQLRAFIFLLSLSCFSRVGAVVDSESFIVSHQSDLQRLNEQSMRQAIDQLCLSRRFSIEASRKAMELCIAGLIVKPVPPPIVGWLYRKLIDMSPSRKYACDHLMEVDKLLREKKVQFDVDDINSMVAKAYNCALMLIDLDQLLLAEQFVQRSLSLSEFSSAETQQYNVRMQVCIVSCDCVFGG
jgi:hypothetical protein